MNETKELPIHYLNPTINFKEVGYGLMLPAKIYILVGKSGVGKTTLQKLLKEKYSIEPVIGNTNRKPRVGEKQNVDYHFMNSVEFRELPMLVNYTVYDGTYHGTTLNDIKIAQQGDKNILYHDACVVMSAKGVEDLKTAFKENAVVIKVTCPEELRKQRMIDRGDTLNDINRRMSSETDGSLNEELVDLTFDSSLKLEIQLEKLDSFFERKSMEI